MLELDLLFKSFNDNMLDKLSQTQLGNMQELLDQDDNILELWLLKGEEPPDKHLQSVCAMVRDNALLHS